MDAPLDRSATWRYEDGQPGRFSYARADHPTGVACEEALGALDGGYALLYPSGMREQGLAAPWPTTLAAREFED